jgi:polysaccharide export outer membrane protein
MTEFAQKFRIASLLVLLFSTTVTSAQSQGALPSADSYRLGPGDTIDVRVFGESDLSLTLRLGEDGRINYAFVGEIYLEDMTLLEVEREITRRLRGDYLLNPQVSVTMAEYRPFFIQGEVARPGSFPYQPGLTVSKAISLAGGLTERASDRKIFLVPDGGAVAERMRVSLDDLVGPGDTITIEQSFF